MGRRRRLLSRPGATGAALLGAYFALAVTQPQPATSRPAGLPEDVWSALHDVRDFTYDFDQPGYYALLRFMKATSPSAGEPLQVSDWRELIERPRDFRGELVAIEGIVGRNKDPYVHRAYEDLGPVWQVELRHANHPITCTVVFTKDVSDVPLGARVHVAGRFVKINRYPTRRDRPGLAALLISRGPTAVTQAAPLPSLRPAADWRWLLAATLIALAVTIFMLRRSRGRASRRPLELRASRAAPVDLSADLADWAETHNPDEGTDRDR